LDELGGYTSPSGRWRASVAPSTRRSLLKKGLVGGAILLLGGTVPILLRSTHILRRPRQPLRILTANEHAIFAAVAVRICPRDQTAAAWPSAEALQCAEKVDTIMAELHPKAAAEFKKLLHVFESGMTGLFSIASPTTFTGATEADQDRRLQAWRRSRVALFRSGYQAMKRLSVATYYASPETYAHVGYPGPPVIPRGPS
jgi:Gluconate 2-dehydrogenase subunit 3